MSDFVPEYVSAAAPPTRADIALKAVQHARVVKQLWIFIASIIGFLTVVNFSRRLHVKLTKSRPSVSIQEKDSTIEGPNMGNMGKPSLRRLPSAVASLFRVVMFRRTLPLGPGGIISMTEATFIIIYMVVHLILLFVDSESQ